MDNNMNSEDNKLSGEYSEHQGSYSDPMGDETQGSYTDPGDDFSYRSNYSKPSEYGSGFGIASVILGIISIVGLCFCLGPVTGLLAVIFGVIQIKRTPNNKGLAIGGIVTGAIGILLSLLMVVILIFGITYSDTDITNFEEIYQQIESMEDI